MKMKPSRIILFLLAVIIAISYGSTATAKAEEAENNSATKENQSFESLSVEDKIENITTYYEDKRVVNDNFLNIVSVAKVPVVVNSLKKTWEEQEERKEIVKDLRLLIEEVGEAGRKHEEAMKNIFQLAKEVEASSKSIHQTLTKKATSQKLEEITKNERMKKIGKVKEGKGRSIEDLEALVKLSEGDYAYTTPLLASISSENSDNLLFFEHELKADIDFSLRSQFLPIKNVIKLFDLDYVFVEERNLHIIEKNGKRLRVIEKDDGLHVEINQIPIEASILFKQEEGVLYADHLTLIKTMGYSIEFASMGTPILYIYEDRFPASPVSLLSVEDLIETTFEVHQTR